MKDYNGEFEYKGRKYKLVFNLNVMEQIQDEYGSFEAWGKLTDDTLPEPNVKAIKFGFSAMINEAIDIENDENGTKIPHLTKNIVGRMITEVGISAMTKEMMNTVIESTKSEEKNV